MVIYNNMYLFICIFGLHVHFWHRASKTHGISSAKTDILFYVNEVTVGLYLRIWGGCQEKEPRD